MATTRIDVADLGNVDLDKADTDEVSVSWDNPPKRRRPGGQKRPSKWITIIRVAEHKAAEEARPEVIDGQNVMVGPWASYPDSGEPTVGAYVQHDLTKAFGKGNEYSQRYDGDYFEIMLRDTIEVLSESGKSKNTKGVLYVRKIIVPKEGG